MIKLGHITKLAIPNKFTQPDKSKNLRRRIGLNSIKIAKQYSWDKYPKKCILNY